ncbi:MAG TPA: L-threonine 3-dehydrogenase [Candidatus Limnocylindria bacterium]|nr:L-threonine 3-dehydrogenase [Candidatus Limnocylindria bacterium]
MSGTMRALAKTRPAPGAELIERPVPSPGAGEVLLRIEAASICGTDAHLYHWDPWAAEILKPPIILGHELAGRVVGTGDGVSRVREGDLVGVESHIVDWTCPQCRSDQAHLCRNLKVIGAHVDGGFAEFAVIPEANAIESNGLDPAVVALQEPMGNAVHAAFAEPIEGRTVAVTGCGPIGLCAVAVAKAAGAAWVVATDVEPYRLEMARRMGADLALDGREADLVAREVMEATGGDGVEVVLEMSGAQPALDTALAIVTRGGRISLLGIFSRPPTVDLSDLVIQKGIRLYGIYGRRLYDTWERTQALLRGGLDVTPVITHRFSLAEWEQGFALIDSRHAGKVVLVP